MRLITLLFLAICGLGAASAFAEDVPSQPLTRADCDIAGLVWDDSANVCAAPSGHLTGQPLTRLDCDQAGLTWDDNANVCRSDSEFAEGSTPAVPALLVTIDKDIQRMTVTLDGVERYVWPVSTGQPG